VIIVAEEKILWEGASQTLQARATSGRFAEHYCLTSEHLNVQTGILTSQAHQVRLADIADVDLKQSFTQKATGGTGDIILTIERPHGGHETLRLLWVEDPREVRDMIGTAILDARQRHLETTRYTFEQPPAAAAVSPPRESDVIAKLEGLGRLHDAGVVSDDEFQAKKAELLSQM
jgi:Bacterial PH domain/Short C-terminal domain